MSRLCRYCNIAWTVDYEADCNTIANDSDTTCPQCDSNDALPHDDLCCDRWSDIRYVLAAQRHQGFIPTTLTHEEYLVRLTAARAAAREEVYGE